MRMIAGMKNSTELLTVDDLADLLRTTRAAIHTMRYRGVGPPAVRIGKRLLFPCSGVEAWLVACAEQRDDRRQA